MQSDEIRALLQTFQDGYTSRDVEKLDEFMQLFSSDPEVEVIGTSAIAPGTGEWCRDLAAVRELVEGDWLHWGDLVLDVADARITTRGEVAWLAASGKVTMTIPTQESYQDYLDYIRTILDEKESSNELKLHDILRGAANTLFEIQRGEVFVWPIRFTAVAVKEGDGWRFHQMQFSFPTTRFPDERIETAI